MTDDLHAAVTRCLLAEKRAQAHDAKVERRIETLLAVGGKFDLADPDNIEEAICEAPPTFWQSIAKWRNHPDSVGSLCANRNREYWYKRAKEEVEEEIEAERMRALNPELVNRDE